MDTGKTPLKYTGLVGVRGMPLISYNCKWINFKVELISQHHLQLVPFNRSPQGQTSCVLFSCECLNYFQIVLAIACFHHLATEVIVILHRYWYLCIISFFLLYKFGWDSSWFFFFTFC